MSDKLDTVLGGLSDAFDNITDRLRNLETRDPVSILSNLAPNGALEYWIFGSGPFTTTGSQFAPGWYMTLAGGSTVSILRASAAPNLDTGSQSSAAITYTHAAGGSLRISQAQLITGFRDRPLAFSARVKGTCAARLYFSLDGGSTYTYSDYSQTDNAAFETLTLEVQGTASSSAPLYGIELSSASGVVYLDNTVLVESFGAYESTLMPTNISTYVAGYVTLLEIPTILTPPADWGYFYTKDLLGITTPYFKGDDGVEHNLLTPSIAPTGYVPYTGATADVNLGVFDLYVKSIFGTDPSLMVVQAASGAAGALLQLQGGDANVTNGAGGAVFVQGGVNTAGVPGDADGGDIRFQAGVPFGAGDPGIILFSGANNNAGLGGDVQIEAGYGTGANGGNLYLLAGPSTGGTQGGNVLLVAGAGTGGAANGLIQFNTQSAGSAGMDTTGLLADRNFVWQDQSGTVALLSDIPGVGGFVPYTGATSNVDLGVHTLTTPTVIGGTAAGSSLVLQSTSGVGTTDFIKFAVGNAGATESFRVLNTGYVTFGNTVNATAQVLSTHVVTDTSAHYALRGNTTNTQTATASQTVTGVRGDANASIGATFSNSNSLGAIGVYGRAFALGAGTLAVAIGVYGQVSNSSTGTITNARAFYVQGATNTGGGTITTGTGMYIDNQSAGSTNNYGINVAVPVLDAGIGATTDSVALNFLGGTTTMGDQTATTTNWFGIRLLTPTLVSTTNVRTLTNVASIFIQTAPTISTNVAAVNGPYGLWVGAGNNRMDGKLMVGAHTGLVPVGDMSVSNITGGVLTLARHDVSVTAADVIGRLDFRANDTSTTTNFTVANIEVQATNTITTDINPGRMIFRTTPITVAATPLERFRLDEQGSGIFFYRMQTIQGADVASANNLVLGGDGNVFEITGTTQTNLIANTNWQNGSVVILLFTGIVTVKNATATSGANTTILLAGGVDFVSAANNRLTLVLAEIGGTQAWREVARSL